LSGEKEKIMANAILTEADMRHLLSKKESLQMDVYNNILSMLLNKELVPGQFINRREVAGRLGVSVAPVLEAFVLLEQEGFVQTLSRKGTIVSPATDEQIYGSLIVREALEIEAASFYCGEMIRRHYDELITYAKEMDTKKVFSLEHAKMEIILHSSLVNLANVPQLFSVFTKNIRLGMFFRLNSMQNSDRVSEHQHHESFINALCTDDKVEAGNIVRDHVRSGKKGSLIEAEFRLSEGTNED
jgi:DNA-binding GntR family transcriptional regulator